MIAHGGDRWIGERRPSVLEGFRRFTGGIGDHRFWVSSLVIFGRSCQEKTPRAKNRINKFHEISSHEIS